MFVKTAILSALALVGLLALAPAGEAQGAPADTTLIGRANASRTMGADSARLTIIELGDFQCPSCRQYFSTLKSSVDSAYVKTGKAKFVFYNMPLPIHNSASAPA